MCTLTAGLTLFNDQLASGCRFTLRIFSSAPECTGVTLACVADLDHGHAPSVGDVVERPIVDRYTVLAPGNLRLRCSLHVAADARRFAVVHGLSA